MTAHYLDRRQLLQVIAPKQQGNLPLSREPLPAGSRSLSTTSSEGTYGNSVKQDESEFLDPKIAKAAGIPLSATPDASRESSKCHKVDNQGVKGKMSETKEEPDERWHRPVRESSHVDVPRSPSNTLRMRDTTKSTSPHAPTHDVEHLLPLSPKGRREHEVEKPTLIASTNHRQPVQNLAPDEHYGSMKHARSRLPSIPPDDEEVSMSPKDGHAMQKGDDLHEEPQQSTVEPTRAEHQGVRQKLSHMADKVGDLLHPSHHTHIETIDHVLPAGGASGMRIITEFESSQDSVSGGSDQEEEDVIHPEIKKRELQLPPATQNFLNEGDHSRNIDAALPRHRHRVTTVLPGPAAAVPASSRSSPSVHPRVSWSSDSRYSDDESVGTEESDQEAIELLAVADSGPGAERQTEVKGSEDRRPEKEAERDEERPSGDQLKGAKEALMDAEVRAVKVEDKQRQKERLED